MPKQDYLPKTQAALPAWLAHFLRALPELQAKYGVAASEVTELTADQTALQALGNTLTDARAQAHAATAAYVAADDAARNHVRALVRTLKNHRAYTAADGALLGLIGADATADPATAQPTLSGTELPGARIELAFDQQGWTGVKLYGRRAGETEFTFLAVDTAAPYLDTRSLRLPGQPEEREYKARYLDGDDEIGLESTTLRLIART